MTREQWKERLKRDDEMRPFKEAFANGKPVEVKEYTGKWQRRESMAFDSIASDYRIVESPKYRKWTMDEAPVNCMVRLKGETEWVACIGAGKYGIRLPRSAPTWSALLENYEHSIDGGKTWLPCGVEVK